MKPINRDKIAAEMRSMRSRVSGWLRWLAGWPAGLVTERAVRVWIVLVSLVTILIKRSKEASPSPFGNTCC